VQRLVADHDRVQVELVLLRIPGATVDAAEQLQQSHRVQASAPRDAVLAVGRERHVVGRQGPARPDLGRFLAEQGCPDAQFSLALQRDGLGVHPPDKHHVPVHALEIYVVAERVIGVLDPLAFWGQELDKLTVLRRDCGRTAGFDGHVPLLSGRPGAGIANAAS
jgi:hypothetical protein